MAGKAKVPAFATTLDLVEDEIDLTPTDFGAAARIERPGNKPVDLSDLAKVIFLRARERSGKTLLARYLAETVLGRDGELLVAALDQAGKRRLADFIEGVQQPATRDAAGVARWLEAFLSHLMKHRLSALVDTGGGDMSMPMLFKTMPGLEEAMRTAGVQPVVGYIVGGDPLDLSVLAADVAAGFQPEATFIVLNHGLVDPTMAPRTAFSRVMGHRVMKDALGRGAILLEMARLRPETAARVDAGKLHLRTGDGDLDVFGGLVLRQFVAALDAEFEAVKTWLP